MSRDIFNFINFCISISLKIYTPRCPEESFSNRERQREMGDTSSRILSIGIKLKDIELQQIYITVLFNCTR